MIKAALEYFAGLARDSAKPNVMQINGKTYTDMHLIRMGEIEYPDTLQVSTLTAIEDFVRRISESEGPFQTLIIQISDETNVYVKGLADSDGTRPVYVHSKPKLPTIRIDDWISQENFIIMVESCFLDQGDKTKILNIAGNIQADSVAQYSDDGISQRAVIQNGISSKADVIIPGRVMLTPYRTFLEVSQPESQFAFRIRDTKAGPEFKLIEADGGAWKLSAMERVREHFKNTLTQEIEDGKVLIIA